jgi:hypothetical protein
VTGDDARPLGATAEEGTNIPSMSDEEKRHDELTRAPKSSEEDAAPRITLSEGASGATRIDVADTAVVRPGEVTRND